jgi:hypothetical protein
MKTTPFPTRPSHALAITCVLLALSACSTKATGTAVPASPTQAPAISTVVPATSTTITTVAATTATTNKTVDPTPATSATLVWVGTGEAYRFEAGQPVRVPTLDYSFDVVQHRNGRTWNSIKNLRFDAAGYDGAAGAAEQVLHFDLAYDAPSDHGTVSATVASNLGTGNVDADTEFRNASITIALAMPTALYDTFRITQHYDYEAGRLTETVDLMKRQPDGTLVAVFQNREVANVFGPTTFNHPPTVAV